MPPRPRPPAAPPAPAGARDSTDLGYGSFSLRTGYLRQDTRPVPFVSVKLRRHVRLDGTRLSVAKGPAAEVIWSFDIGGAVVEAVEGERKLVVWLTDSMRKRRRVIVLVARTAEDFERWRWWLRRASEAVLERHYSMSSYINTGSFARVVRGRDLHDGREVAIKLIEKSSSPPSELRYMAREVAIMRRVRHENVVRCLDVFDGVLRTRIVMELCPGVLQDIVDERGGSAVEEGTARAVLRGVLRGLNYLHGIGIVHRDIKPSNILLSTREPPYGPVKLSDFGLSNYSGSDDAVGGERGTSQDSGLGLRAAERCPVLSSEVGTLAFVAPDLLRGDSYGPQVDLWSAGIVLYIMLAGGRLPFRGETSTDVLTALKVGDVDMAPLAEVQASRAARSLLRGLLNVDPEKRLTAAQALDHPWLAQARDVEGAGEGEDGTGEQGRRKSRRSQSAGRGSARPRVAEPDGQERAALGAVSKAAGPPPVAHSSSAPAARGRRDLSIEAYVSSAGGSRGHALLGV